MIGRSNFLPVVLSTSVMLAFFLSLIWPPFPLAAPTSAGGPTQSGRPSLLQARNVWRHRNNSAAAAQRAAAAWSTCARGRADAGQGLVAPENAEYLENPGRDSAARQCSAKRLCN